MLVGAGQSALTGQELSCEDAGPLLNPGSAFRHGR